VVVVVPEKKGIDIETMIRDLYVSSHHGDPVSTASKAIALELGVSKKIVYEILLQMK
jgi:hypothetical protein